MQVADHADPLSPGGGSINHESRAHPRRLTAAPSLPMDTASPAPPLVMATLTVERHALLTALRSLARLTKPAKAGDAILSLIDGELEITIGGAGVSVPATGRWPGQCRILGSWVLSLAQVPPAGDPLVLRVEEEMLSVNTLRVACHWQEEGAAEVQLPMNADFRELLTIGLSHDEHELRQSGILPRILEARDRRGRIMRRVAYQLRPFKIPQADIEAFVDRHLLGLLTPSAPRPVDQAQFHLQLVDD